jgi:imidazolonepropionase-like amidohydrolase
MSRTGLLSLLLAFGASAPATAADTWVLEAGKLYSAPDVPAINDAVVLIRDGKIVAAGARNSVQIPKGARNSECSGGVVTAGFQNSHVHFMEAAWNDAAHAPAAGLTRQIEAMLTRYGFTTVFDTASDVLNTVALRQRIEKGDIRGPRILTAGIPLYPPDGIPFYLRDLPPEVLAKMNQQPRNAAEARENVRQNLASGADGTKLFLHTSPDMKSKRFMSIEVARAAVEETHARGKLVLAHPTSLDGVRGALAAGVDILVHTTLGEPQPWDAGVIAEMKAKGMSVIPTFKLWPYELRKGNVPPEVIDKLVGATLQELRSFSEAGGQVLFGTDVGYMHDYDPSDEYHFMAQAGLSPMQILASLTTAPAARWKESARRGRVAPGLDADLVVLTADPAPDVRNFASVRCAFRMGNAVFTASSR